MHPLALLTPAGVVVSVSPAHLLLSLAEVQVEAPIHPRLSLAGIAGAGVVAAAAADRFTVLEVGGQVRVYPVADGGAHLALEVLATRASRPDRQALGLGGGLLGGWQWEAQALVFEANGGLGYRVERREAVAMGARLAHTERGWRPMLNVNLGYRF